MRIVAEVINAFYNDDTERIELLTALKNVQEVDPPEDTAPGTPVDDVRWIRQVEESFVGRDLEVQTVLNNIFTPSSIVIAVEDVSRFPNNGSVTVNREGSKEEVITYSGRNTSNNTLIGISEPVYSHEIGEIVRPSVEIDFLGTFEIDLQHYPIRRGHIKVLLNGVTELRENSDFYIINVFDGNVCSRGMLRFLQGGRPKRFRSNDFVEVEYQYFDQTVSNIEIPTELGQTEIVDVYQNALYELYLEELDSPDRSLGDLGNIRITPPLGTANLPPTPVSVTIPEVELPINVTLAEDIDNSKNGGNIKLSSVANLPRNGTLSDSVDDAENRKVTIEGEEIYYEETDLVTNELLNISGIASTSFHAEDTVIEFDGARYTRDVVKDAINRTSLRAQLEAFSVYDNGYHIVLRSKITNGSFNLQPGTYNLFYIGFDDAYQRGLHQIVQTMTPFENKNLTFRRYTALLELEDIADSLIGKAVTRRVSTSPGHVDAVE